MEKDCKYFYNIKDNVIYKFNESTQQFFTYHTYAWHPWVNGGVTTQATKGFLFLSMLGDKAKTIESSEELELLKIYST